MQNDFYLANSVVSDDITLIKRCLEIYSITQESTEIDNRLRPFELSLLSFYIRKGISKETNEEYKKDNGVDNRMINVTTYHLRNKGYLIKGPNSSKNRLNNHLEALREAFINNDCNVMVVRFEREN